MASFGFLGSNTVTGPYQEDKSNTKRFNIYKYAMEYLVGELVFIHSMDIDHSLYLLVNRKNHSPEGFVNDARKMLDEILPELED